MKKIFSAIVALSLLGSCVERDELIPKNEIEKTKLKTENSEILKKETDSTRSVPMSPRPIQPGFEIDPGEVGPIVTTPPK